MNNILLETIMSVINDEAIAGRLESAISKKIIEHEIDYYTESAKTEFVKNHNEMYARLNAKLSEGHAKLGIHNLEDYAKFQK